MDKKLVSFLTDAINQQGYLFQEKCSEVIKDARSKGTILWNHYLEEYPVKYDEEYTKIDLVLQYKDLMRFVVLEFKKPNPAYPVRFDADLNLFWA
jgi:hypothetical protein